MNKSIKTVEKHGLLIQVDKQGREYFNNILITSWDSNNVPRSNGKYIPGTKAGNPGGKIKLSGDAKKEVLRKCLSFAPEGIDLLIEFAKNPQEDTRNRIKSIEIILDRGLGKVQNAEDGSLSARDLIDALPAIFKMVPGKNTTPIESLADD